MKDLYILISVNSQIRGCVDVDPVKLENALVGLEKINALGMALLEAEGILHLKEIARQISSQYKSY